LVARMASLMYLRHVARSAGPRGLTREVKRRCTICREDSIACGDWSPYTDRLHLYINQVIYWLSYRKASMMIKDDKVEKR
jgi:hypothetical protein